MTRDEVIKRLEAAIEGSRELDANIAALAWPGANAYYVTDGDRPTEIGNGEWLVLRRTGEGRVVKHRPPEYSTSTDAALLLVPKTMGWEITFQRREHLHVVGIDVTRNTVNGRYEKYIGRSKTTPLAVCAAALKAAAEAPD